MDSVFDAARWFSVVAFLGFGLACLTSRHMVQEFERYGLARLRVLVGSLEMAGALGLWLGAFWTELFVPAALGLSLLMLSGVLTRIRIHDSLLQMLPALGLLGVNVFLVAHALGRGAQD